MEEKKSIVSDRSRTDKFFERFVRRTPSYITPNFVTVVSIVPYLIFAFLLWFSKDQRFPWNSLIFLLTFIIFLLAYFLDGLDGALARARKKEGKWGEKQMRVGDVLDHTLDRYFDLIIFAGIYLGGYCSFEVLFVTVSLVLLVSYLGSLTKSVYGHRAYGGVMGRFARFLVLGFAILISFLLTLIIGLLNFTGFYVINIGDAFKDFTPGGFTILGWAMIIVLIGSFVTVIQRHYHGYRIGQDLVNREKNSPREIDINGKENFLIYLALIFFIPGLILFILGFLMPELILPLTKDFGILATWSPAAVFLAVARRKIKYLR